MFKPLLQPAVTMHHSSNPTEGFTFWQAEFEKYMTSERGLSSATTRGRRWIIKHFLEMGGDRSFTGRPDRQER